MGTSLGGTRIRFNYYPVIPDISKVKPGQIRCGEHNDYGGITLLIQDDVGGLEVGKALIKLGILMRLHVHCNLTKLRNNKSAVSCHSCLL